MRARFLAHRDLLAIAVVVVLYLLLAATDLTRPGLQADEALHAPAALRLLHPESSSRLWVHTTFPLAGRDWPVMIMPYLGAVKSYLLAAAFLLFGVSVTTLRLTMIGVAAAALVLTYWFVQRRWGRLCAIITAAAVATDPSFVIMTRADWGPVALPALCRAASMLALVVWLQRRTMWSLATAGLFLGIGVYDKSNFLWFVFALIVPASTAYVIYQIRPSRRELLVITTAFLVGSGPLWWWNLESHWQTFRFEPQITLSELQQASSLSGALWAALPGRLHVLSEMLKGHGLDGLMFDDLATSAKGRYPGTLLIPLLVSSIALIGVISVACRRSVNWPRLWFPAGMTILLLGQMLVTPLNIFMHHYIFLYPFPQLFVGAALSEGILNGERKWSWNVVAVACGAAATLWVATNTVVNLNYHALMRRSPGSTVWSTAIYDLEQGLSARYGDRTIQVLDWGIGNPLVVLSGGRLDIVELGVSMTSDEGRVAAGLAIDDRQNMFVLSAPGAEVFKEWNDTFREVMRQQQKVPCWQQSINDAAHRPRYLLMNFSCQ